jgi:hypothetical protein
MGEPDGAPLARRERIERAARAAFAGDLRAAPRTSLRAGCAVDSYDEPPSFDEQLDAPTDEYLERHAFWGLAHVDADSWRHYLPQLMAYAFAHMADPHMAVEGLLHNLRPPERDPPRLGTLSAAQEAVVVAFLEELAFAEDSANQALAMQVLDEWWLPGGRYRPPRP